jgi:hypothetical protein
VRLLREIYEDSTHDLAYSSGDVILTRWQENEGTFWFALARNDHHAIFCSSSNHKMVSQSKLFLDEYSQRVAAVIAQRQTYGAHKAQ